MLSKRLYLNLYLAHHRRRIAELAGGPVRVSQLRRGRRAVGQIAYEEPADVLFVSFRKEIGEVGAVP